MTIELSEYVIDAIADAVAKKIKEPKTGHWIEKDEYFYDDVCYECSECGEIWSMIDGTPWQNEMHYCPNCGARMAESEE